MFFIFIPALIALVIHRWFLRLFFLFKRISLFTVLVTLLPVIVLIECFIYGNLLSKFYACIVLTTERFIWSLNIFSRGE